MADIGLLIVLFVVALAGLVLAALQMPGTWLILASAVAYDWHYHWQRLGWKALVALGVVALLAEVLELSASVVATRKAGASRRASWGALIGGFAGMILLSVPIPLVGTIIGGLIGCFAGALVAEMTVRDDLRAGTRVGVFAAIGRLLGTIGKLAAAIVIAGSTLALAVLAMF